MSTAVDHAQRARQAYVAWGLQIRSELALPEVKPGNRTAEPDIEIAFGPVPENLAGAEAGGVRFQLTRTALLLRVDGVARYFAEAGRRVTIAREPRAADEDVRLFLLGIVCGALLEQRHDLVLRGSAVEIGGGGAAVFMGGSGLGKSTLAALLHRRGHAVLTDDVSALRGGGGGDVEVHSALPQLNLWPDVLAQLGRDPMEFSRVRGAIEKRALRLGQGFAGAPVPVRRVYVLSTWNRPELRIEPLEGAAKIEQARHHLWRTHFDAPDRPTPAEFRSLVQLARQARFAVIRRPMDTFQIEELVSAIEADAIA